MVGIEGEIDLIADRPNFVCPVCSRSFASSIGLGVHKQKAHLVEYNEEIGVTREEIGVKPRWSDEEIRLLAMEEARAPPGTVSVNLYLLERHRASRSLEATKGIRRKKQYKNLVVKYRDRHLAQRIDESIDQQDVCAVADIGHVGPSQRGSGTAMD